MRLIQLVVMIAGSYSSSKGSLSNGGFVGFLLLVGVFLRPIEKINSVIETYPKGIAGFRRYTELLDTEPDIADRPDAVTVGGLKGDIRYDKVSFGYGDGKPVLKDIDLWTITPARPSPSSVRPAPARPPSARCCRASTRSAPARSPSTASISGT
jgi:ABC-type multidrug transport system fused ATPase/permease subunit